MHVRVCFAPTHTLPSPTVHPLLPLIGSSRRIVRMVCVCATRRAAGRVAGVQ